MGTLKEGNGMISRSVYLCLGMMISFVLTTSYADTNTAQRSEPSLGTHVFSAVAPITGSCGDYRFIGAVGLDRVSNYCLKEAINQGIKQYNPSGFAETIKQQNYTPQTAREFTATFSKTADNQIQIDIYQRPNP